MTSPWLIAMIVYCVLAVATLLPTLKALFFGVELHPGGVSFDKSTVFSDKAKSRLSHHFSRLEGTLQFWKKQAEQYKRFHYYSVYWTIPASVVIPFLAQAMTSDPYSKWLITIISAHVAILLSFHRGLKVERNYRAFRQGESDFYDLYRRMLDRPETLGANEAEQLANYFDTVENIRKLVRNAEIDNLPTVEQLQSQVTNEPAIPPAPVGRHLPDPTHPGA